MQIKFMNMLGTEKLQNAMGWNYAEGFVITCAGSEGSYRYPPGPGGSHFLLFYVMISL